MPTIMEEILQNETNKVFFFEGFWLSADLEDFGDPGNIFAFQSIQGLEEEQHLFTKTYPNKNTTSRWIEAQYRQCHQKKSSNYLILNLGLSFWQPGTILITIMTSSIPPSLTATLTFYLFILWIKCHDIIFYIYIYLIL